MAFRNRALLNDHPREPLQNAPETLRDLSWEGEARRPPFSFITGEPIEEA